MSGNPHRILMLGHSGFIGTALTRYVARHAPGVEVVGRSLPECDLTRPADVESLRGLLGDGTAVIFLAGIKRQFGDNLDTFSRNLAMAAGVARLLQECPAARVIYFSSAAVYGEDIHNTAITEQTAVQPASYYGIAKFAAECLLRKSARRLVILRPPTAYGPGDQGNTYGPASFIRAVARREPVAVWGDGTELREFVFVNDIAAAVHALTCNDFCGVLNMAGGVSCSFRDILSRVQAMAGTNVEVVSRPRTKNKVDNVFDARGLRAALPGLKFTPLEEGLRRTYEADAPALVGREGRQDG